MTNLIVMTSMGTILVFASITTLILVIYGIFNKENSKQQTLLLLMISLFFYTLIKGGEAIFTPLWIKMILIYLEPFSFGLIPFFWFIFILEFTNNKKLLKNKKLLLLVAIIPIATIIGGLFNSQFPILWKASVVSIGTEVSVKFHRYPLIIIYHSYSILILFISSLITLNYLKKIPQSFKRPTILLTLATLIPIPFIFVKLVNLVVLNVMSIGYFISTLLLIIIVFYYNGLEYIPLVHESFIKKINVGMMFFNSENKLIDFNPAASLLNIKKEDLNKNINEIFPKNLIDFYYADYNKIIIPHKNQKKINETRNTEISEIKWLEIIKNKIVENNKTFGTTLTIIDITNLKNAENQANLKQNKLKIVNKELNKLNNELNKSNQEKAVLLKEVHHRVKNNLQIMVSLLNLDERFNKNSPDKTIASTRNRINTMALIHEKTYQSENLANINAKEFIIENINNLIQLYDFHNEIKFKLDLNNIFFSIDIITPLGLIINEIITNSIKYAFNEQENKKIFVSLKKTNDSCILTIQDNGKGFPENLDIHNSPSLGLTIINSLTEQLEGKFTEVKTKGAGFKIEFPINKK